MSNLITRLESAKADLDGTIKSQWESIKAIDDAILALSTDAEPVGMQHRYRTVGKHVGEWQGWQDGPAPKLSNVNYDIQERHVYAAPPAPAVAVKALLDDVWNAAVEKAAAIADDCVHLTPDPGAAIKTMLNGRAKLHPSSDAALSAQVQDVATATSFPRASRETIARIIDPNNYAVDTSIKADIDNLNEIQWAKFAQKIALLRADEIIAYFSELHAVPCSEPAVKQVQDAQ